MKPIAHLIDDDEAIRDSLSWLLESRGIESRAWSSAESFLEFRTGQPPGDLAGCMILDIRMDGMSGLELFDRLVAAGCRLPVIFLTGHGDVPMAVGAIKNGAFDFFEKPFDDAALVKRVSEAMALDAQRRASESGHQDTTSRLASLSERERQVMDKVLAGKLNKVIADELSISMRTVEVHRSRVFEKMGVKSAVELAQRLKSS